MSEDNTTQEVTPEAQAAEEHEQEQPKRTLSPEEAQAELKKKNSEAKNLRDRLKAAEEKLAEADKAKAQEAERQAKEQGKFAELYEAEKAKAAEAQAQLQRLQHDAARKDAAQAAGIPQLWQRLQGATAEELAEDAKTLAAYVQPKTEGNGQPARAGTTPTPQAQGRAGLTDEERRARAVRTF